jgi:hypothetical protein
MFKIPEKITLLEIILLIILIIKLVFLYALVRLRAAKARGLDKETIAKFENLEGITHKLFFVSMSVLMIYLFRPHALFPKPVLIDGETKTFLFVFALLTLFGIDYKAGWEEVKKFKKYYLMGA